MEGKEEDICIGKNGKKYKIQDMFQIVRELLGNEHLSEVELKEFMRTEMFLEVCPDLHEAFNHGGDIKKEEVAGPSIKTEKFSDSDDSSALFTLKVDKRVHKAKKKDVKKEEEVSSIKIEKSEEKYSDSEDSSATAIHRKRVKREHKSKKKKKKRKREKRESNSEESSTRSTLETKKVEMPVIIKKEKEEPLPAPIIVKEEKPLPPPLPLPKPYTFYDHNSSKVGSGKHWKPQEEPEFAALQKLYKLRDATVLCVDLTKLSNIFHNPSKGSSSSGTIPLKRHMTISDNKAKDIERHEKHKSTKFKPLLTKLYSKNKKKYPESSSSSSRRNNKVEEKSSAAPLRKGSFEWKKEQRRLELERLRERVDKKNHGTRKLPWEREDYFAKKKAAEASSSKKPGPPAPPIPKRTMIPKIPKKHAPAMPIQNILQQISEQNKAAAQKPKVELKIPKISQTSYSFRRPDRSVTQGAIAIEVDKLLRSNTIVHCPTMTSNPSELAEFTIRKLGWWILKNEQDPADDVIVHPELHDHEVYEEDFQPDEDMDDDISVGNVSDPEGTNEEEKGPREPELDPDVLDEYCGYAGLETKIRIRKPIGDLGDNKEIRDKDDLLRYIKVKPGSNYEKPNFEAKCHICGDRIVGQRHLGAHIRSAYHKDNFRNYSLKFISAEFSEEKAVKVQAKIFNAKLVRYTVEDAITTPSVIEENKSEENKVGADELPSPDSPSILAQLESKINSPTEDIIHLNDLEGDDLSLPSLALYDLEPDEEQLRAKICLRTNGLWSEGMDKRWEQMLEQEAKITERYNDLREKYIDAPESHPLKNMEWEMFWDKRSLEVEAEGKDPNTHDYGADWIPFWFKRMQELMKNCVQGELLLMKQNLGLDSVTLKNICADHGLSLDAQEGNGTEEKSKTFKSAPASPYDVIPKPVAAPPPPPPPVPKRKENNYENKYRTSPKDRRSYKEKDKYNNSSSKNNSNSNKYTWKNPKLDSSSKNSKPDNSNYKKNDWKSSFKSREKEDKWNKNKKKGAVASPEESWEPVATPPEETWESAEAALNSLKKQEELWKNIVSSPPLPPQQDFSNSGKWKSLVNQPKSSPEDGEIPEADSSVVMQDISAKPKMDITGLSKNSFGYQLLKTAMDKNNGAGGAGASPVRDNSGAAEEAKNRYEAQLKALEDHNPTGNLKVKKRNKSEQEKTKGQWPPPIQGYITKPPDPYRRTSQDQDNKYRNPTAPPPTAPWIKKERPPAPPPPNLSNRNNTLGGRPAPPPPPHLPPYKLEINNWGAVVENWEVEDIPLPPPEPNYRENSEIAENWEND